MSAWATSLWCGTASCCHARHWHAAQSQPSGYGGGSAAIEVRLWSRIFKLHGLWAARIWLLAFGCLHLAACIRLLAVGCWIWSVVCRITVAGKAVMVPLRVGAKVHTPAREPWCLARC
jgi:hypothetical protein